MMSEKAPDAYRTISEVAEDLDLPQHVLRFWETRFSQIKPLKRGGGRRYYRPDDLALLRGIRELLYRQGYTIKGVQRILRDQGIKAVQAVGRGEVAIAASPNGEPIPGPQSEDFQPSPPHGAGTHGQGGHGHGSVAATLPPTVAAPVAQKPAANGTRPDSIEMGRSSLQENQRLRLRAALFELAECRRLLDTAKASDDPGEAGS